MTRTMRVPNDIYEEVTELADARGVSTAEAVRLLMQQEAEALVTREPVLPDQGSLLPELELASAERLGQLESAVGVLAAGVSANFAGIVDHLEQHQEVGDMDTAWTLETMEDAFVQAMALLESRGPDGQRIAHLARHYALGGGSAS